MRGKVLLPLLGGAQRIVDPQQVMSVIEHELRRRLPKSTIKLCRVNLRERDVHGDETLEEYDVTLSSKELFSRLRAAFLELGDHDNAQRLGEEGDLSKQPRSVS